MTNPKDAADALASRLEKEPTLRERLLRVPGVTKQLVYTWKSGDRRPGPHFRDVLQLLAGIPREAWMDEDEQKAVRCAEKLAREAA